MSADNKENQETFQRPLSFKKFKRPFPITLKTSNLLEESNLNKVKRDFVIPLKTSILANIDRREYLKE